MSSTRAEFDQWLESNHLHLKDYSPYEVSILAHACGFETDMTAGNLSEWRTASTRRLKLWESPFHEKWLRAHLAQNGADFQKD